MERSAAISDCGKYRFRLDRRTDFHPVNTGGTVLFVLNNPSTADGLIDDPTCRKGWKYTQKWGYHHMVFLNTNPFRSTDPDSAIVPPEDALKENDEALTYAAHSASLIICAWGMKAYPVLAKRATAILQRRRDLHMLDLSNSGVPKHILYLKDALQPQLWKERCAP